MDMNMVLHESVVDAETLEILAQGAYYELTPGGMQREQEGQGLDRDKTGTEGDKKDLPAVYE